ncbi:hypothetical protein TWF217_004406 [Orbilia oligospora]|nr:hypothetical protein TWF217_004406 [Orbilia oligospora]
MPEAMQCSTSAKRTASKDQKRRKEWRRDRFFEEKKKTSTAKRPEREHWTAKERRHLRYRDLDNAARSGDVPGLGSIQHFALQFL